MKHSGMAPLTVRGVPDRRHNGRVAGRYEDSLSRTARAIELDPVNPVLRLQRAQTLLRKGLSDDLNTVFGVLLFCDIRYITNND